MRSRISILARHVRNGLLTGLLLGVLHAAILATRGLYATSPSTVTVLSFARHMGLFGLTGGLCGLLAGAAVALPRSVWLPLRAPCVWLTLITLYGLAWLGFGARHLFGVRNGVVVLVAAGLLAGTGLLFLLRRLAARGKPEGSGPPLVSTLALLLGTLILFALPVPTAVSPQDLGPQILAGSRFDPLREQAASGFAGQRWNLLLLTVDTLRADHLGCYGYDRETSPAIDALARSGVRFENAICQRPKTSPSFATLLTGTYPAHHGIHDAMQVLDDRNLTLAEILAAEGWTAAGVITNGNLYPEFGFDQGFEAYLYGHKDARTGTDLALEWLEAHGRQEKPWFLWVHHTDPHAPYSPPPPYDQIFSPTPRGREREVAFYDGEIRFTDDQLGRVLAWIDQNDLRGRTLIVFTSDHGESLGEHDYYYAHGLNPYEPSGRVPLVFSAPGVLPAGAVSPAVVSLVDLLPTVLDALGVATPEIVRGHSILPAAVGLVEQGPRDFAFLEAGYGSHIQCGRTRALRRAGSKYVQRLTGWARRPRDPLTLLWTMDASVEGGLAPDEFYDLKADPGETVNLLRQRADPARLERELLETFAAQMLTGSMGTGETSLPGLSPDARESLKSLGYIGD